MEKIDVAVQSYKKPESLIYTLLSLKKHCGEHIDTIYINDDCSGDEVISCYKDEEFLNLMKPIKIKIRVNKKKGGYKHTLITKEVFKKRNIIQKLQLLLSAFVKRAKFYSSTEEIRYQWAINNTDKKYLFIIHDDIKFNDDVAKIYINELNKDSNMAIVGDFAGSHRCPYGPCGTKECNPQRIISGYRPSKDWPVTGSYQSIFHLILGRKKRNCRINEWCCMINVEIAKKIGNQYGVYFGNVEFGGDTAVYWFEKILKKGYHFNDPIKIEIRKLFYQHCWQGHAGHAVWVKQDMNAEKAVYQKDYIKECIEKEFNYKMK